MLEQLAPDELNSSVWAESFHLLTISSCNVKSFRFYDQLMMESSFDGRESKPRLPEKKKKFETKAYKA